MTGYSTKIVQASKELSAREKLQLKDTSDCIKLDDQLNDGALIITPIMWAVLDVHNEKSENKDYNVYIVMDKDGQKYVTGSNSFWASFDEIIEVMQDDGEEEFQVKIYKLPSKNYKGKEFITCSII